MPEMETAERLVVNYRPWFEINGAPDPRLAEDLVRLETCDDEEGVARLEAVFVNWDRATETSEPGFVYFDTATLDLGNEIVVHAGDEDDEAVIFRGVITAIQGVYPELRPPELIVRAEDRLHWLRMRQRTRYLEDLADSDMASMVASDNGFTGDVQANGPTHAEFLQVNQSELGHLRERARAIDARLGFETGGLVFRPRREAGDPPIRLTRQNQLLRFHVGADIANQRAEVRVHGYSVADKAAIHERAGDEVARSEADGAGRTGPEVVSGLNPDAVEDLHLEAPATADEARALAETSMRRRARRFVCGRGVTSGTPKMRVGSRVDIVDLGPWFSGIYYVAEVRHTFEYPSRLRTHFLAERAKLGAGP